MKRSTIKKVKKELKNFMKDESGVMSKENILKVGIGTVAALGVFSGITPNATAGHFNFNFMRTEDAGGGCLRVVPDHTNHTIHQSY